MTKLKPDTTVVKTERLEHLVILLSDNEYCYIWGTCMKIRPLDRRDRISQCFKCIWGWLQGDGNDR